MNYKEPDFETRALQHSKVKLTWEDEEPERKKVLRQKFNTDEVLSLPPFFSLSCAFQSIGFNLLHTLSLSVWGKEKGAI